MSSAALQLLPPADQASLLALTTPPDLLPAGFESPDPIHQADFLTRPDIQPHLDALRSLADFRDRVRANHISHKAADILLEVARETNDLVEKRRAATAVLKFAQLLLTGQRHARKTRTAASSRSELQQSKPVQTRPAGTRRVREEPTRTEPAESKPATRTPTRAASTPCDTPDEAEEFGPTPVHVPAIPRRPRSAPDRSGMCRERTTQIATPRVRVKGPRNTARPRAARELTGAAGSLTPLDSS